MEVYKIVLTGGPCAGKTQIFKFLEEKLTEKGYYVISIDETARGNMKKGILPNQDRAHTLMFQWTILNDQKSKEENAEVYANSVKDERLEMFQNKKGIIILHDRAIMDNRAYLSLNDYEDLLKKFNYQEINLIDKYDLVIDLISLATTNKELYVNDEERKESVEDAEHEDLLTSNAWMLHHNLVSVKATKTIKEKANIVLNHIEDYLLGKQKEDIISLAIDEEKSDLSIYNDDNSKKIKVTNICLNNFKNVNYVLSKREYKGNISYVSRKEEKVDNTIFCRENKQISKEECLEKILLHGIRETKEKNILSVVDKGNFYNIVRVDNDLFLETNLNNYSQIPNNIVLKHKTLTRTK